MADDSLIFVRQQKTSTSRLRLRQPHVREHRGFRQVPAEGIRGRHQVHRLRRSDEAPVKDRIDRAIPNPTFQRVAPPGGQKRSPRAPFDRRTRRVLRRRASLQDDAGIRDRPVADVADPRERHRAGDARRPARDARRVARPQRVDVRTLDVRLRGRDLPDAGDRHGDRRQGDQGARVGGRARRADRLHPPGAGVRAPGAALLRAAGVRPVLGRDAGAGHDRRPASTR